MWNAEQYLRFGGQRLRPVLDLMAGDRSGWPRRSADGDRLQVLQGDNAVLEWVKGSALVPVRDALPVDDYAHFTERYGAALREAYPRRADGTTLLPFRRLFIVARRGGWLEAGCDQ